MFKGVTPLTVLLKLPPVPSPGKKARLGMGLATLPTEKNLMKKTPGLMFKGIYKQIVTFMTSKRM